MIVVTCSTCGFELRQAGPMSPPVIANHGNPDCQHTLTATGDGGPRLLGVFVFRAVPADPPPPSATPEPAPEPASDLLAPWARYLEGIL